MKLALSRRYSFPASHRLYRPEWTEEQNQRVFGKCANPHGHGHNYVLEVSVTGSVDGQTGMIVNLADLDEHVRSNVLAEFDHANLNEQISEFRDSVPTTENLCRVIFKRLAAFPHARLDRIRIEETGKNSFEFSSDADACNESKMR